jgi:hypothetical protein
MCDPRILIRVAVTLTVAACLAAGGASSALGGVPTVRPDPSSLRFASTGLGHAEAQTLTLTNASRKSTEVRFRPEPSDGAFSLGESSCPAWLAPGGSCSTTVWFRPEHLGLTTGTLVYMLDGSPLKTYQVHLSGEAHRTG